MFWLVILAMVAIIFVLTWIGAKATMQGRPNDLERGRRRRGNDGPIIPGAHDDHTPFV